MSEDRRDELERYLAGEHPAKDAYRSLDASEPSAATDAAILAAARDALDGPGRPRYLPALAMAASVTLAVGLGWFAFQEPVDTAKPELIQAERRAGPDLDTAGAPSDPASEMAAADRAEERITELNKRVPVRQTEALGEARSDAPVPGDDSAFAAAPAVRAPEPSANADLLEYVAEPQAARTLAPTPCPVPAITAENLDDAEYEGLIEMARSHDVAPQSGRAPSAEMAADETVPLLPLPTRRLVGIAQLLDAGEDLRARQCFSQFERDFPDYDLPDAFPIHRLKD